jgi:arylsulfatase A-like enzyme
MSDLDRALQQYLSGSVSRRDLVRRLLSLGVGMGFVETLLGPGIGKALAAPDPRRFPSHAPYVVLVVMDAFRADYEQLTPMPNLRWLMDQGTSFPNAWVGQLESYTPTGHATLSTGATPSHDGVIGFSWRDPKTGKEAYTAWWDGVMSGRLEAQLTQHGVNSIPQAMKRQDPHARVVALSSEKYYAADAMGGAAADYIIFGQPMGKRIVTRGIPHHLPPQSFLKKRSLSRTWPLTYGQFDEMAMTMALESLASLDPRLLMINLPGADIYGHRVGGPASPDVMRKIAAAADAQLGRLIAELRRRGMFDQTIFVVTADHGMVGNTFQLDDTVIKNAIADAGGQYLFHVGGNSAYIWLKNPHAAGAVAQKMVDAFPTLPLYRSADSLTVAFAHFQTFDSGQYTYHPVVPTGTEVDPELEKAYQYLLHTMAGPIAPDIALWFQENTITSHNPNVHGEHGGGTWGAQHIPLVIAGPGVQGGMESSFPARLVDVAPTVLTLLGIQPDRMDGVVLADALSRPTDQQQSAQDHLATSLKEYQAALMARSKADIAQQSGDSTPPPKQASG